MSIRDTQMSFAGGLNTVSDDIALGPTQVRLAQNARLTEYGAITKRYGSVQLASAALPAAARNGASWFKDNGDVQGLAVAGTTLYTINMLATPGTTAWTAQTGTLSSTTAPSFAAFRNTAGNDVVFIADGGLLNYWTGSALVTDIASTQDVTFLKVHNQRLWGAGSANYPDSIF